LHEGEADLALIPLADYFQHGGYQRFGFGIVADGPVESVLLFSNSPIEQLREVYLDSASHTSVALLKILLKDRSISYSRRSAEEGLRLARERCAAGVGALVIGNNALNSSGSSTYQFDLAELWREKTGLPFVFAVWAYRPGVIAPEQLAQLEVALARGVTERTFFARAWADSNEFLRDRAERYVTENIHYQVTDEAWSGAEKFRNLGAELGLFPALRAKPMGQRSGLDLILSEASQGHRISCAEALALVERASFADLALAADLRREALHREPTVSYIVDRNINYTNVCNVYCRFCAFYSAPGKKGGYLLTKEEIGQKIEETVAAGGIQILLQGGLNPELGIEYYEDLFRWIKGRYPINLHALSADEVWHIVRVSKLSLEETMSRLIQAGLGSFPGGGAEILVDRVRRRIARLKTTANEWLEAHRMAHRLGITSTCTMMFGVRESWEDRLFHLEKLRSLQDETGGFTAFITWSFQADNTNLAPGDTTAPEYLKVQALSRLFLDNIPNIQSSWVTQGPSVGQIALQFGANDFGSVMFEENVVSAAGTTFSMDALTIEAHIRQMGFVPWQRDVHYNAV